MPSLLNYFIILALLYRCTQSELPWIACTSPLAPVTTNNTDEGREDKQRIKIFLMSIELRFDPLSLTKPED
jgi:hypothetical protein